MKESFHPSRISPQEEEEEEEEKPRAKAKAKTIDLLLGSYCMLQLCGVLLAGLQKTRKPCLLCIPLYCPCTLGSVRRELSVEATLLNLSLHVHLMSWILTGISNSISAAVTCFGQARERERETDVIRYCITCPSANFARQKQRAEQSLKRLLWQSVACDGCCLIVFLFDARGGAMQSSILSPVFARKRKKKSHEPKRRRKQLAVPRKRSSEKFG